MENSNQKCVAVFGLDGTLLDTLADLTDSVNFAMEKLGLPTHSQESVRDKIGSGVSVLMSRVLGGNSALHNQVLALQRAYYKLHGGDKTHPYSGATEALRFLRQKGVTVVVHTNKDEAVAKQLCHDIFGSDVDFVCGTVDDSAVKPNVVRLNQLLASLNATNAVYCGDSDVDIATAKNAGLPCVSATWGFRTEEFLKEHGATYFAATPVEAAKVILELLNRQKDDR